MKHRSALLYIFGENYFTANINDATGILNLCMDYRVVYRGFHCIDKETVGFYCSSYSSLVLERLCRKNGIKIKKCGSRGIPPAIWRYRNRVGILIGMLLALMIVTVSDDYIWDIKVSGNETVTYSRVIEALSARGLTVGSKIKELDVDKIKTNVMVDNEDISWMTINVIGTVAHVQIRDRKEPLPPAPLKPANIVASRDGQIEYLEVFHGEAAVRSGEAVRKGDILISGIHDFKLGGFGVTRANGRVYAITEHTLEVEVPYDYVKKNYYDTKKSELSLIFFSKNIKLLKNGGNYSEFCDTIEGVDMMELPGGIRLPIGIRRVSFNYYTLTEEKYTAEEAMEIAYYRLEQKIADSLREVSILRKNIKAEIGDSSYKLVCYIQCIEDIAEVREFDADLS